MRTPTRQRRTDLHQQPRCAAPPLPPSSGRLCAGTVIPHRGPAPISGPVAQRAWHANRRLRPRTEPPPARHGASLGLGRAIADRPGAACHHRAGSAGRRAARARCRALPPFPRPGWRAWPGGAGPGPAGHKAPRHRLRLARGRGRGRREHRGRRPGVATERAWRRPGQCGHWRRLRPGLVLVGAALRAGPRDNLAQGARRARPRWPVGVRACRDRPGRGVCSPRAALLPAHADAGAARAPRRRVGTGPAGRGLRAVG